VAVKGPWINKGVICRKLMGRHGMPCDKENENGQLLFEIFGKHGLVIGGTIFPHKEGHKVTWISTDKDK